MKGILMAGGTGSRLFPNTEAVNKQLIPVFDKPMIYYPLSVLMLGGITEIMIICNKRDYDSYQNILGDGSQFGINITYAFQTKPNGIAAAFTIAKDFIGKDSVCLILGDNIFCSNRLGSILKKCVALKRGSIIFAYSVADPKRYGIVNFNKQHHVIDITEKPKHPKTNFAIPGIYFFDNRVSEIADQIKPSDRGELEITDVIKVYLKEKTLTVAEFGRGSVWFDAGTIKSLYTASEYIETIESRQGLQIACLEEIALKMGYITIPEFRELLKAYPQGQYKKYLTKIMQGR
ncbi:glucose-1-phosphate thymidylyltransferase RfbA [Pediococcus acidilactici]|uniref:glucose-1-phosphate thymidylyltransferase RfbA n=1 Tax=Pediococcus acidilactici TaxID=1254 RepID=UPI00232CE9CB|nr:glucose-1-phosphate thymidylyltransferase RfbA [Pediococcus acidilactici]MDB8858649.1 glucose-1-phosphate thymidylyltransferase RfbA [Pediococcus acidilactici]MDB8860939.1 glucose-1-phosphate thymidylyltransferase RfbA [Pediococcus acidilactici]MDB8862169.1 glucose-1-phosphate thymidylyltransferase RfbA [Pediococcus acidilactici]MDB8865830.1 glucose-1-phosphate thymidylyltransferase RfbA [Pediococcus acidilactici]